MLIPFINLQKGVKALLDREEEFLENLQQTPSRVHNALRNVGKFPLIITTNMDELLERFLWKTGNGGEKLRLDQVGVYVLTRHGFDVEFHMRAIIYQFESLRIKKCGIWLRRRIFHVPKRIRECGKHNNGHIKVYFFPLVGKFVMKIVWAWLTQRMVNIWIKWNTLFSSLTDLVEDATEPSFSSFESRRIDLDVPFHMHRIELFDLAHAKFDLNQAKWNQNFVFQSVLAILSTLIG